MNSPLLTGRRQPACHSFEQNMELSTCGTGLALDAVACCPVCTSHRQMPWSNAPVATTSACGCTAVAYTKQLCCSTLCAFWTDVLVSAAEGSLPSTRPVCHSLAVQSAEALTRKESSGDQRRSYTCTVQAPHVGMTVTLGHSLELGQVQSCAGLALHAGAISLHERQVTLHSIVASSNCRKPQSLQTLQGGTGMGCKREVSCSTAHPAMMVSKAGQQAAAMQVVDVQPPLLPLGHRSCQPAAAAADGHLRSSPATCMALDSKRCRAPRNAGCVAAERCRPRHLVEAMQHMRRSGTAGCLKMLCAACHRGSKTAQSRPAIVCRQRVRQQASPQSIHGGSH